MALPSGYIPCNLLGGQNCYFDTGVVPSSDLEIIGQFVGYVPLGSNQVYYFGARNSNSNTSAGQLNFLNSGGGVTSYLGYASARVSVGNSNVNFNGGFFQITKRANEFEIADYNLVWELTGATTTFTGTKSMFLLAMNNAGNVLYGTGAGSCKVTIQEFSISQNGTELHHYVPVYDENNAQFGLYDLADGTFLTNQGTGSFYTSHILNVQESTGGQAWLMCDTTGYTKKKYIIDSGWFYPERLVAYADPGYEFLNWTDGNGNILSTSQYFEYQESSLHLITSDTTITANFVKKTKEKQDNRYQLLGLQYGVGRYTSAADPNGNQSDLYSVVLSFECAEDTTSASTSTIELLEVPSTYQINMPVFLFTPRGKIIWCGLIKEINGNVLTCREPTSAFDLDVCFSTPTVVEKQMNIYNAIGNYLAQKILNGYGNTNSTGYNAALKKKGNPFDLKYDYRTIFGDSVYAMPTINTGVSNAEEFMFSASSQYGVIYGTSLRDYADSNYASKGIKHLMQIEFFNPAKYGTMQFGTNSEAITNVEIIDKNENANSLMIYNSAGTTLRGIYGVKNDGSIADMSSLTSDFLAYSNCSNKVISSDDSLKSLIRENLGNAIMNHKITFDVDLESIMYSFDDFRLGRRVKFYDGNKLYNSMITALSFAQDTNEDIKFIKVTLGNVRTKLVTKLNIGKGK